MKKLTTWPKSLKKVSNHYCPGCGHGVVHRLIAEVIDELDMRENTIGVAPVGCSVTAYDYLDFDMSESAHGRAPAVATGIKRIHPDKLVFTYQGDGDLAAIGTAEIIHAANRGELFTTIFINNAIYGMTSGQMAPTSLLGMITATSPNGRSIDKFHGGPIKVSEMISTLDRAIYIERCIINNTKGINRAKKAIKKAFQYQLEGKGFTMVEILTTCNINWKMTPTGSIHWMEDNMIPVFPTGVIKDLEPTNE